MIPESESHGNRAGPNAHPLPYLFAAQHARLPCVPRVSRRRAPVGLRHRLPRKLPGLRGAQRCCAGGCARVRPPARHCQANAGVPWLGTYLTRISIWTGGAVRTGRSRRDRVGAVCGCTRRRQRQRRRREQQPPAARQGGRLQGRCASGPLPGRRRVVHSGGEGPRGRRGSGGGAGALER